MLKMYPLKFVIRNVFAGSLKKRLPLEEGTELNEPIVELYKDDGLGDPMINHYHAKVLGISEDDSTRTSSGLIKAISLTLTRSSTSASHAVRSHRL